MTNKTWTNQSRLVTHEMLPKSKPHTNQWIHSKLCAFSEWNEKKSRYKHSPTVKHRDSPKENIGGGKK